MKKLITLITVMALLLSFALPAMAEEAIEHEVVEEPAAVEETVEEEAVEEATEAEEVEEETSAAPTEEVSPQLLAGQALVEIGIVQGYADGSLGLENTITRAEMAALIVKGAGLTAEAEALKGSESKFSDVNAGAWFAGLVNLSAEKGWITGDPEGTFRPNDPVQYREAITMVMRALGYSNENLGGQWPENFVNKAVELELSGGIELNSNEAAPRGDVFVVLAEAIDFETASFSEALIFAGEEAVEEESEEATTEEVEEEVSEETTEETQETEEEVEAEGTEEADTTTEEEVQ